ncbi:MAG: AMP-binding protein [Acidimicrobiales bacterium]
MALEPVLVPPHRDAMVRGGYWRDRTLDDWLADAVAHRPDHEAVVAYRRDRDEPVRLGYAELDHLVDAAAHAFTRRGVEPGDVVAYQLPNWWELVVISLACARIGAVAGPLMPIFRQRELRFMLGLAEAKVLIVPTVFRGFDHAAMAHELARSLDHPMTVLTVGDRDDGGTSWLTGEGDDPAGPPPPGRLGPDDVALLMYTSGTTGEPKGVMHTSNTLLSGAYAFAERMGLDGGSVVLGASPMAHLTGYGYLVGLPIVLGATTVCLDQWDPARALGIVAAEGITFSMASSPFVADLCAAAEAGAPVSDDFARFVCAGAPIPPVLIERAHRVLGLTVCSAWGMTENGAATLTEPDRAAEKSATSDGRPMPGMELRVVGAGGEPLPAGTTGSLQVRGPQQFAGYLHRPQLNATDTDGWFTTGDLAFLDDEGYVRIDGRTKDLIIRGGENIPVLEVEHLLYRHPAVEEVAVVGYPDERLGERACAFVTLAPGGAFDLPELRRYLAAEQVAVQYHPERVVVIDAMPRTPSGKIQKFKLRHDAAGG